MCTKQRCYVGEAYVNLSQVHDAYFQSGPYKEPSLEVRKRAEVELKIIRAAAAAVLRPGFPSNLRTPAAGWIHGKTRSIVAHNSSINVPHRSSFRGEIGLITFSSSDRDSSRSAIFSSGTTSLSEPSDVITWVDSRVGSVHNSPPMLRHCPSTSGTGLVLLLHDMT